MTARESHYEGTSRWFVEGDTFAKWKSSDPDSLLWIHGKRGCLSLKCSHFLLKLPTWNSQLVRGKVLSGMFVFLCSAERTYRFVQFHHRRGRL